MLSKAWSTPTLNNRDFEACFDLMLWTTRIYGVSIKPPVPKALLMTRPVTHWDASDPNTVFDWAEHSFGTLINNMALSDLEILLVADARRAEPNDSFSRERLIIRAWQYGEIPAYQVNAWGKPVVYYDPRKCDQPGYFLRDILPKLASLKIASHPRPDGFFLTDIPDLITAVICHSGQGLSYNRLLTPDSNSRSLLSRFKGDENIEANRYLYMAIMGLAARRYSPEQIIASYGPILSKSTRKRIFPIYKRIENSTDCIKLLRMMTDNRLSLPRHTSRSEYPAHSRPHQALV